MKNNEYKISYNLEESYWWFVGKQFLVRDNFKRLAINRINNDKILDIGCGTGIILKFLENFGISFGMELSSEAIHFLMRRDLKLIARSDANQSIPFKSHTFAAITCLDVLEHLDNDLNLLREAVRVCKPGGNIIITVPAFDILWSAHDEALHHKRRYTLRQILKKVGPMNCNVIKASYYNTCLFLPIFAFRKINLFLFKKKHAQSDFFLPLPEWLNKMLILLYIAELKLLRCFSFPFGVSILLILQKLELDKTEKEEIDRK
ncbi:class I SAM-dependent methyltransferase [Thermodesulfobacteriota bacterium]